MILDTGIVQSGWYKGEKYKILHPAGNTGIYPGWQRVLFYEDPKRAVRDIREEYLQWE